MLLLLKSVDDGINIALVLALRVLVSKSVCGDPLLIVLKFMLHSLEVNKKVVLLSIVATEVQLHSRIVALLQLFLQLGPIVVEVLVEVGQLGVGHLARSHAPPEDHTSRRLEIQTLVVSVPGEGHDH